MDNTILKIRRTGNTVYVYFDTDQFADVDDLFTFKLGKNNVELSVAKVTIYKSGREVTSRITGNWQILLSDIKGDYRKLIGLKVSSDGRKNKPLNL